MTPTPESLREAEELTKVYRDKEGYGCGEETLVSLIATALDTAKQQAREEQAESDARLLEGAVWPEHLGETKMVIQQAADAIRSQAGRGEA